MSGEKIKARICVEAIFRFMELKAELLLVNIIKNVSDGWCLRCELGHCICIYVSSIWCIVLYLTWLGQLCSALSSAQPHSTAVGQATLTLVHHTIMDLDILSVQGDLMLHTGWLPATKQTPVTLAFQPFSCSLHTNWFRSFKLFQMLNCFFHKFRTMHDYDKHYSWAKHVDQQAPLLCTVTQCGQCLVMSEMVSSVYTLANIHHQVSSLSLVYNCRI